MRTRTAFELKDSIGFRISPTDDSSGEDKEATIRPERSNIIIVMAFASQDVLVAAGNGDANAPILTETSDPRREPGLFAPFPSRMGKHKMNMS